MDPIEKLYNNYEALTDAIAKNTIAEQEKLYAEILNAVHGSDKEKKLASQFIPKFVKHFPQLTDTAIDRQLDLCEDEDLQIRRQAIKDLPLLCKENKEHTAKIADILCQLLAAEDPLELQQVHLSLLNLIKFDAIGTLTGIFSQISSGDEASRTKSFQYLANKFVKLGSEVLTAEVEAYLIAEMKKVLQDVTADEFHLGMSILAGTRHAKKVSGHADLVQIAVDQAELDADLAGTLAAEDEVVERFIQCATEAMPYFCPQVQSTPFVRFMCEKLLPVQTWNLIAAADEQSQTQLRLLKVFAELCGHCGTLEKPAEKIEAVYTVLLEYMPLPPPDVEIVESPSFQFSHAECLLYALHALGKQAPEFLQFGEDAARLKDFRARLQYLARGTQGYIKRLQEAIRGKTSKELKEETNQIKVTALKTTSNISALIRDLFHSPPSYKASVHLSWLQPRQKKLDAAEPASGGDKRHIPIVYVDDDDDEEEASSKSAKRMRSNNGDRKLYQPPGGRFSSGVRTYGRGSNRFRSGGSGGGGGGRRFRRY